MVTLPSLESYSDKTLGEAKKYSPVIQQYLHQLSRKPSNYSDQVRIKKHGHWLECALATFTKQASPEEVCLFWSQKTDELLKDVWNHHDIPTKDVSLLCFGKLGSNELNLSSDIDIVFVRSNLSDGPSINTKVKAFIKTLSENSSFGFAYRVDLDLRPGGNNSPLVPTKKHFYNFYDEYLEAWHRLSFVRMRPLFNEGKLNEDLLSYCQKRSFPKRLDFSVIQEIKNVRSKIAFQWRKAQEPLDLKLHPGGIRDIELYIHSLLVIYGGRNPELKVSRMNAAITELAKVQAIGSNEEKFLREFYWKLRKIENLIHIKEDQHTYLLQKNTIEQLSQFNISESSLINELKESEKIIESFFQDHEPDKTSQPINLETFNDSSQKAIAQIRNLKSTSIKKHGIEQLKEEILAYYIHETEKISIDQDLAIQAFRDFILAIKSKSSIFHLLSRHKELLTDLAWLFSISPFVGQLLCRRPELIDSFALRQVAIDKNGDLEALWENLIDYKMLGQLMAIIHLFKKSDAPGYFRQLSEQADFIVQELLSRLSQQQKSAPLEVLTLGKWSGFELGIRSDLDFVFLSEQEPDMAQIKVARRVMTLLTSRSNAGRLYDIDLRLKPNENAGPLILHKPAFFDFIANKAEHWQKQAYLRSRLIGTNGFYLKQHFNLLRLNDEEIAQLDAIHDRLLSRPTSSLIDVKSNYGGLIHTEFTIQKLYLKQSQPPQKTSTLHLAESLDIESNIKRELKSNYNFLRKFEQILQICNDSSSTKVSPTSSGLSRIAKVMGDDDIFNSLARVIDEQWHILKSLDLNH